MSSRYSHHSLFLSLSGGGVKEGRVDNSSRYAFPTDQSTVPRRCYTGRHDTRGRSTAPSKVRREGDDGDGDDDDEGGVEVFPLPQQIGRAHV